MQEDSTSLKKVTLNLFEIDVARLEQRFGHGWSGILRNHVHRWLNQWDRHSDEIRGKAHDQRD